MLTTKTASLIYAFVGFLLFVLPPVLGVAVFYWTDLMVGPFVDVFAPPTYEQKVAGNIRLIALVLQLVGLCSPVLIAFNSKMKVEKKILIYCLAAGCFWAWPAECIYSVINNRWS